MLKKVALSLLCFLLGAIITATPFFILGHLGAADEAARGEPTMGPGITTFLGLLAAPLGGLVAVIAYLIWIRRPARSQKT